MYLIWRVIMTGVCILLFGLGSVLSSLTVFPVIRLCTRDPALRRRRARLWLRACLRALLTLIEWFWLAKITVTGKEILENTDRAIIVANHPTLIDVVILFSLIPAADCIVKASMWRNPFTRGSVEASGYIRNDGAAAAVVETCVQRLSGPCRLVVFPEGTRSPPGKLAPLSRSAARIALRSQAPLIPVSIHAYPPMLTNTTRWYKLPSTRSIYHLRVGEPLWPRGGDESLKPEATASRELTAALRMHFEESLFNGRV